MLTAYLFTSLLMWFWYAKSSEGTLWISWLNFFMLCFTGVVQIQRFL